MNQLNGIDDILALTPLQQGMLFHTLYTPESSVRNLQMQFALEGELDEAALERAWELMVQRHAALRTSFVWERVEKPYQVVHSQAHLKIARHDWRALGAAEQEERWRSCLEAERSPLLDLRKPPLMRLALIVLSERKFRLIWTLHHIILEGWSAAIILDELWKCYRDLRAHRSPDLPPVKPYAEFIHWLQQKDQGSAQAYWREKLKGFGAPNRLAIDRSVDNAPAEVRRVERCRLSMPRDLTEAVRAVARKHRVTLNTVVQGAWSILLSRYSGEQDVVFGAVLSGRPADLPGVESIVGLFVNTLPARVNVDRNAKLVPWLQALQLDQATMRQYDYSSLMQVQTWSDVPRGQPLFHTALAFQNWLGNSPSGWSSADLQVTELESHETSDLPLTLQVIMGDTLTLSLVYDVERFDRSAVERMLAHFRVLIEGMVSDPDRRVADLPLLTQAERHRVLVEWNATAREYGSEARLHRLIEAQARLTPDRAALEFAGQELTYAQVNQRANRLARVLRKRGVGPDVLVGVLAERSFEMVLSLLAILKAGGAYVPLDPSYPQERLRHMLEDARARLVLVQPDLAAQLPPCAGEALFLDAAWTAYAEEPGEDLDDVGTPDDLAYVIFTSGSTGRPKGGMNTHRGICNRLLWMQEEYRLGGEDRVMQKTPFSFDVSVWEFFWPLMTGARLVIALPEGHKDGGYLVRLIRETGITTMHFVPSMLRVFLEEEGLEECRSLRRVICSGEALPHELQQRFFARLPGVELHNLYGPTEAAVDVSYWRCRPGDERPIVPIGRPVANTQLYVLDPRLQPVPIGVPGELYIGGVQVGRGYVGRPDLTAERFVPDPFSQKPGARLYRTGDLVRHLPDGEIDYLGRLDHQVKIRGYRIELGEIETEIARHPAVREAVVVAREDVPGEKRLVAYVVARNAPADLLDQLRARLRESLPPYMYPAHFVFLDALPLTSSGKANRRALPAPDLSRTSVSTTYVAPRTPAEDVIAQIWRAVLGVDRVGIHDHFFEVGGDSILSIQVVTRCRQAGFRVTPRDLFKRPTIALLAEACAQPPADAAGPQEPVAGVAQLTPIQRWFLDQEFADQHHWNQAFLFEVPAEMDLSKLAQALHEVLRHHDALRLRLRQAGTGWLQQYAADKAAPAIASVDLAGMNAPHRAAAIARHAAQAHASLNLADGPLLKAVHFSFGVRDPGRLLLVIHHIAVDGVSWRLILEDLESAYLSLNAGERPALPAKTTSYQAWAAHLADLAKSAALERSAAYWLAEARKPVTELPAESGDSENLTGDASSIKTRLTAEETRALLQRVPLAYRTQINDTLLAALARALQQWTAGEAFRIDLEGHGREELFEDVDLSRTVGWFTTLFPVRLELQAGWNEGRALTSVKEQLRRVPDRGLSYGLLRHGCGEIAPRAALAHAPQSAIRFNYLGQFDQVVAGSKLFRFAEEPTGPWQSPASRRTYALDVLCLVRGGELEVEWAYHPRIHSRETIERLAQSFVSALRGIIQHCLSEGVGGRTPSDFPLAVLTQDAVDALWARYPGLEDAYPLSPMQRLFYVMQAARADRESEPWHFRVDGAIDAALLKASIERVVQRYPMLRTAFVSHGGLDPLQVVLRRVSLPWSEEDWRGLPAAEQEARIAVLLQVERTTALDLTQAPLMRVALRRIGDEQYQLIWKIHQLYLDGWSWPLVFSEVSKTYDALRQGVEPAFNPPCAYRSYVAWLQHEAPDSKEFWKGALAGFDKPTPLNLGDAPPAPERAMGQIADETAYLDRDTTAALQSLARSQRVTVSTIVQGAWALLLGHYSGLQEVVFGAAFSGRPTEVPGIEWLIGPCATNLPVRVRIDPNELLSPWLTSLQQRSEELWQHQYTPLEQIQMGSQVPWRSRLFDSLVVFQNYQIDAAARQIGSDARLVPVGSPDGTQYPLTVMVIPDTALCLRLLYRPDQLAADVVKTYARDLVAMLGAIAGAHDQKLANLLKQLPASTRGRAAAVAAMTAQKASTGVAIPPRTRTEQMVLDIFREMLDQPEVSVFDSFFDLGGHSVAAVRLMSRLRAASGVDVPLRNLFERPTVAALAQAIDGLQWLTAAKPSAAAAAEREEIEL